MYNYTRFLGPPTAGKRWFEWMYNFRNVFRKQKYNLRNACHNDDDTDDNNDNDDDNGDDNLNDGDSDNNDDYS